MKEQRVAAIDDRNPLYTLHLHAQMYSYVNAYADHAPTHTHTNRHTDSTTPQFELGGPETAATAREDELQQHMLPPTASTSVPNRCYEHAHVCPGVRTYAHVCMTHRWYHQVHLHLDLAEVHCLLWAQLDYLSEKVHVFSRIQPVLGIQLTVL